MKGPSAQGRTVECPDFSGRITRYEASSVRFRPAAYGLLVQEHRILLSRSRFTGLWDFPGGGVEPFESLADGMAREFFEETGLKIAAEQLIHVAEGYIAMFDHPFHSLRFYYRVTKIGDEAGEMDFATDEVTELKWWDLDHVPIYEMHASDQEAWAALEIEP